MFEEGRSKDGVRDRVVVIGLYGSTESLGPEEQLDELEALATSAGSLVVGRVYQVRSTQKGQKPAPVPATYVGSGKVEELEASVKAHEATAVVFDNELSPAQIRELEKLVGCRVLDRSELILDIFAGRARTRESRIQVELAQLEYTAPRLRGMWTHLERQASSGAVGGGVGVGVRGPGEKQIEIDRRLIAKRLGLLKKQIKTIQSRKHRTVMERAAKMYCVGLVGYTNAGKSTLLNALTPGVAYTADQLFATLDTKTRAWKLSSGDVVALSDTVGFVRNLPHHLVASFRSTLDETLEADLLLHIIDASHPEAEGQIESVDRVLTELDRGDAERIHVLNKCDATTPETIAGLRARLADTVVVSAKTGEGLDLLANAVKERRRRAWVTVSASAPAGAGRVPSEVRKYAVVHDEAYEGADWTATLELSRVALSQLRARCPEITIEPT